MEYIYPPIIKYFLFLIIIYLFLQYYNSITYDDYLILSILIMLIVIFLDYLLIINHPNIIYINTNNDTDTIDLIDKIIDSESENN